MAEGVTNSTGAFMIVGLEDGDYNLTFILDSDVIGYDDVSVVDLIGDAGVIVIDVDAATGGEADATWLMLLIAAIAIVIVAAVVMKVRKPRAPKQEKMVLDEPSDQYEEDLPPPPPDY